MSDGPKLGPLQGATMELSVCHAKVLYSGDLGVWGSLPLRLSIHVAKLMEVHISGSRCHVDVQRFGFRSNQVQNEEQFAE